VGGQILADTLLAIPFVLVTVAAGLKSYDMSQEMVARSLGAGRLKAFLTVTLPLISPGIIAGAVLAFAKAMGEFGAVAVISGKLRGETVTMPLQIELYYQEFRALAQVSAFSLAAVLAGLALVTLVVKTWLEWRYADELAGSNHR